MASRPTNVTQLLRRFSSGDQSALEDLVPQIYDELRHLASSYLRRERIDHTLQTTALVHEAYIRLIDQRAVQWHDRNHFFAIAAQMMRRILVDHARKHVASKRGSSFTKVSLEDAAVLYKEQPRELIAVDELLGRLARMDPQESRIVELRFFAGLSLEEIAEVMGLSTAKVRREWSIAKTWLKRELGRMDKHEVDFQQSNPERKS